MNRPLISCHHLKDKKFFCKKDKRNFCNDCFDPHQDHHSEVVCLPQILVDNYEVLGYLGKGSYGVVLKVSNRLSGVLKAVKILEVDFDDQDDDQNDFEGIIEEIKTLSKLKHQNLMGISEALKEVNGNRVQFLLIMELCDETLNNFIRKNKFVNESQKFQMIYEISLGIKYMHGTNMMHRDIKPANIFLKRKEDNPNEWEVKIGDFGISKSINDQLFKANTAIGTTYYMSPEALSFQNYNEKTDIFACGIVFYEILFGLHPYESQNEKANENIIIQRIKSNQHYFTLEFHSHVLSNIIKSCLKPQDERISAKILVTALENIINNPNKTDFHNISTLTAKNNIINLEESKENELNQNFPQLNYEKFSNNQANAQKIWFDESMTLSSGDEIKNDEDIKFIKKLTLNQMDFIQENSSHVFVPNPKGTIKNLISSIGMFSNLKELTVNFLQTTYNYEFTLSTIDIISKSPSLEVLNLIFNNRIMYVRSAVSLCDPDRAMFICCTCCVPLCLNRNNNINEQIWFDPFFIDADAFKETHCTSGCNFLYIVQGKAFENLCERLSQSSKLNKLSLDFSFNSISPEDACKGIEKLKKNLQYMSINLSQQYGRPPPLGFQFSISWMNYNKNSRKKIKKSMEIICENFNLFA